MSRFFVCLICLVCFGTARGQSVASRLLQKVKSDNPVEDITLANLHPQVFGDFEFIAMTLNVPKVGAESNLVRSVPLILKRGEKSFDERYFDDFSSFGEHLIKGTVQDVVQIGNHYLLLSYELWEFEHSDRSYYRCYKMSPRDRSIIEISFDGVGFINSKCMDGNKEVQVTLERRDKDLFLKKSTLSFAYDEDCKIVAEKSIDLFHYDADENEFVLEKVSPTPTQSFSIKGTTWRQKDAYINGVRQRNIATFEFDTLGNILLWKQNNKNHSMSSEVIGTYQLSQTLSTLEYQFNGQEEKYIGNIFADQERMIQDAMSFGKTTTFSRSLLGERAVFNEPVALVEKLFQLGWKPELTHFRNILFANRTDLLALFLENGFDANQFMGMRVADSVATGSPLHLAVVAGKLDALKVMAEMGVNMFEKTFQQKTIFDFEELSGNARLKEYLQSFKKESDTYNFPRETYYKIDSMGRRFAGLQEGKGSINKSWYKVEEDILYYNFTVTDCKTATDCLREQYAVYYKKNENGYWIGKEIRSNFPDRIQGRIDTIFSVGAKKFLLYELKNYMGNKMRIEKGIQIYDSKTDRFIKTNLIFIENKGIYTCANKSVFYSIGTEDKKPNTLVLIKNTKTYNGCEEVSSKEAAEKYYWSSRQDKFIKTLD